MKRKAFILITLLFGLLIFTSCTAAKTPVTQQPSISIQNNSFSPQILTIKAGTTVTWTNNDTTIHNIKSTYFNSPDLAKGNTYMYTFNQAGTYDYSCGIHASMTGRIIVEGAMGY